MLVERIPFHTALYFVITTLTTGRQLFRFFQKLAFWAVVVPAEITYSIVTIWPITCLNTDPLIKVYLYLHECLNLPRSIFITHFCSLYTCINASWHSPLPKLSCFNLKLCVTYFAVGYGDVVMASSWGKTVVTAMICVGVVLIPVQTSQLYSQLTARRITLGRVPFDWKPLHWP